MTQPKILFFIADSCPTAEEREAAAKIKGHGIVVFRNARYIGGEAQERCDGVAGLVPAIYKSFPHVVPTEAAEGLDAAGKPKIGHPRKADATPKSDGQADAPLSSADAPQGPADAQPVNEGADWKPNA